LPKDILIERQENFTSNSLEDTSAYIKLMYNKWFKETLHGRVYAMKIKMKQRIELAQESGIVIPVDDSVENIYISIFREISSVQKSLKTIKVLFFVLIAIEIYFTVLK